MFEQQITLNRFLLRYLNGLMQDVEDADLASRSEDGGNSPLWILGHLAVVGDSAARVLGLRPVQPKEWRRVFFPGTDGDVADAGDLTKQQLLDAIHEGYKRLHPELENVDTAAMAEPHGIELLKGSGLETKADFLSHVLTTHMAMHIGQISYWRRQHGGAIIV
ncbi:MAG: DinB family protein [Planctomycetaceae bacterium]|nr:DinB family protein [Planctomycetaceae bacterium]